MSKMKKQSSLYNEKQKGIGVKLMYCSSFTTKSLSHNISKNTCGMILQTYCTIWKKQPQGNIWNFTLTRKHIPWQDLRIFVETAWSIPSWDLRTSPCPVTQKSKHVNPLQQTQSKSRFWKQKHKKLSKNHRIQFGSNDFWGAKKAWPKLQPTFPSPLAPVHLAAALSTCRKIRGCGTVCQVISVGCKQLMRFTQFEN